MDPLQMRLKDVPPDDMRELALGWCGRLMGNVDPAKVDLAELDSRRCLDLTPEQALGVAFAYADNLGVQAREVFLQEAVARRHRSELDRLGISAPQDEEKADLVALVMRLAGFLRVLASSGTLNAAHQAEVERNLDAIGAALGGEPEEEPAPAPPAEAPEPEGEAAEPQLPEPSEDELDRATGEPEPAEPEAEAEEDVDVGAADQAPGAAGEPGPEDTEADAPAPPAEAEGGARGGGGGA